MSKKKISDKVRDEAATICAACASEPSFVPASLAADSCGIEYGSGSHRLAVDAWSFALDSMNDGMPANEYIVAYAEAEALLRTGWTP